MMRCHPNYNGYVDITSEYGEISNVRVTKRQIWSILYQSPYKVQISRDNVILTLNGITFYNSFNIIGDE